MCIHCKTLSSAVENDACMANGWISNPQKILFEKYQYLGSGLQTFNRWNLTLKFRNHMTGDLLPFIFSLSMPNR